MKRTLPLWLLFLCHRVAAQHRELRLEAGPLFHLAQQQGDPAAGGLDRHLPPGPATGLRLAAAGGYRFRRGLFLGASVSYLRYQQVNGAQLALSTMNDFSRKPTSLFLYTDIGYTHFRNQQPAGAQSSFWESGLGWRRTFAARQLRLGAGILAFRQDAFATIRVGYTL